MPNMYGQPQTARMDPDGWDDDVVIPHGRTLVVLSSDCDKLLALDRRSGAFLWDAPRSSPFGTVISYCLGVAERGLFVAGKNVVRRYDIPSGRLVWEREIDSSFGRGALTDDAVYVPVKDSIVKLDLQRGHELVQVGVALTTDDPVGNLFSDGEKLWVAGAGRVYAMTNLEHRLEILAQQIAAGDAEAQLNRMRLYAKQNRLEPMLADLRGAYELLRAQKPADEAAQKLLAAVSELKLAQLHPELALQVLAELFVESAPPAALGKDVAGKRADLIATTLHVVRQDKLHSATQQVLALAPLYDREYLLSSAAQTLDVIAMNDANTIRALETAVGGNSPEQQIIAAAALARLSPDSARPLLAKLVVAKDDRVRLAGARALANLGDRSMLPKLAALLESENAQVRARSHQSLRAMTGQQIAFASEAKPDERAKGVAAWKKWIDEKGPAAKLTLPLPYADVPLGRILFTSHVHGLAIELDADRKEVWRKTVPNPWGCQGLPNGNRLISAYSQRMVIEYDSEGTEVWRKDNLPGPPCSVQRLENGNTLVACAEAQQVIEISPDGEMTEITIQGRPMFARRLENGNTLIALQNGNRVVELDSAQQSVWEARNLNGPCWASRLENGNTLIVQQFTGQVSEFDPSGLKTTWICKIPLVNPMSAQRLPGGNTLISDNSGIREIDPSGEQIRWHHQQQHVSGVSSF